MDLGAFASRVSGVTEGRVHKGDAPPSQQGDDECAMYDDSPGGCWVREPPYHPGRQIDYDKQRDAKEAARKAAALGVKTDPDATDPDSADEEKKVASPPPPSPPLPRGTRTRTRPRAHVRTRALRTTHYRLPCQYVQVDLYFFAYVLTVSQAGLYFCMRQRVHPRFAGWA